eukprot:11879757-Heterocapsa_arctica.AAC.1
MPAKARPALAPAVPAVHPSKGWWRAAEADIWSSRTSLEDPCHDDEVPLPGDDVGVDAEVVVDMDVEPVSEGVDEEWGDGADPVGEGGSGGHDAFVGDVKLDGALKPPVA